AIDAAEAIDQVVVRLLFLQVVQQTDRAAAQLPREIRFERPQVALRGVKQDAGGLRVDIGLERPVAMMNAVFALTAPHGVRRLYAQSVAVQLPTWTAIRQPDRARHDAESILGQALGQRFDRRLRTGRLDNRRRRGCADRGGRRRLSSYGKTD